MKGILLWMAAAAMTGLTAQAQTGHANESKTLVVYFSATGTTEKAAGQIAEITGGTLYQIQPEQPYSPADLDWRDRSSRSNRENNDPASRPAFSSPKVNPADYDTVYLGFPIWWNTTPRIINTFIESHDFTGKTIIPFATSGSSGISNAEKILKESYPAIRWQEGKLLNRTSKEEIEKWINK